MATNLCWQFLVLTRAYLHWQPPGCRGGRCFCWGINTSWKFRNTSQHCNADGFSRLPRANGEKFRTLGKAAASFNVHQIKTLLPVTAKQLAGATSEDPDLSRVLRYCRDGWPTKVPTALQPYLLKQEELSIDAGCLFRGMQIVIPARLQSQILEELHVGHPGIRNCAACQSHRNSFHGILGHGPRLLGKGYMSITRGLWMA